MVNSNQATSTAKMGMRLPNCETGGSRFTRLSGLTEEEGDNGGTSELNTNEGSSANQASKTSKMAKKGKKPFRGEEDTMDVVELSASDLSLIHGIKTSERPELEKRNELKQSIANRIKERVMKDVTRM